MNTRIRCAAAGLAAVVSCVAAEAGWAGVFTWTGDAGTNGWYDQKHIPGSDPAAYVTNWGTVGNPPTYPGTLDDVTVSIGPAVLSYQTAEIRSLTIGLGSTVNAYNGSSLTVNGSGIIGPAINNDGTLLLQYGGYAGYGVLQISNAIEIAGQGQLRFDGGYINGGGTLTNAAGHTIAAGAGDVNAPLVNNGLLDVLYSNATLGLKSGVKTNHSTMQASAGCTLNIHTTVNQSDSGRLVASGGTVGLVGGAITGGTTASTGAGKFSMSYNSGSITDVTNTGLWQIQDGSTLTVGGTSLVNDGTFQIGLYTGGHGLSTVQFDEGETLGGSGAFDLSGAYINNSAGAVHFTHAAGHTIKGGNSTINAGMTNNGTIDADHHAWTLSLNTNAKTNNALMRASNGGNLDVHVAIDQTGGGQILAEAGSKVRFYNGSAVTGGATNTVGDGQLYVGNTHHVALTNVTNSGAWLVENAGIMEVATSLTNAGMIEVGGYTGGSGWGRFRLTSDVELDGTGTLKLWPGYLDSPDGFTLTHAGGHTIHGSGYIDAAVINHGTIIADRANQVLELRSAPKTNHAMMKATGGGLLDLRTPVAQSIGGQILAEPGSKVRFYNGSAVTSGATNTVGDGQLYVGNTHHVALTNVTNSGAWLVENAGIMEVATSLTNAGMIEVGGYTGGSGWGRFRLTSDVELDGTGTLKLWPGYLDSPDGFTLTHAGGHTIHGSGYIDAAVINHGTIIADRANQVLELRSAPKTNHAMMKATGGGLLDLRTPVAQSIGGQILAEAGSKVRLYTGSAITGGTSATDGNGQFLASGGGVSTMLTDVTNTGSWLVENGAVMNVAGTALTNHGAIEIGGYTGGSGWGTFRLNNALQLSGTGTLKLSPGAIDGSATYPLTNDLGHTIFGYGHIHASAAMNNLGTLEARGGTLEVHALPPQFAGSTLTTGTWKAVNGTLNVHGAGPINVNLATVVLEGTTSVFAPIDTLAENQGSFSLLGGRDFTTVGDLVNTGSIHLGPGSKLTVNGSYTQASTLGIDIVGYGNANHGWLAIAGAGSLAGVLDVELAGSFTPNPGDLFTVLTVAGGTDGSALVLAPEDRGMWTMVWTDPSMMRLEYVPEPATLALLTLGGLLIKRRRW